MQKKQQGLFDHEVPPWLQNDQVDQTIAEVVFSEAPFGPFSYLVPDTLSDGLQLGARVRVPLGRGNRTVAGYCIALRSAAEQPASVRASQLKPIGSIIDDSSLISNHLLKLAHWISDYYLCPLGQTIEAIIPAGVRTSAGTREVTRLSVSNHVAAKLTQLKLPSKQATALKLLVASPRPLTPPELAKAAGCTLAPITALRKKGLVQVQVEREHQAEPVVSDPQAGQAHALNDDQQAAYQAIRSALYRAEYETVLVHGVTGSGKTEVYIQAIEEVVRFGRQAIVLVPEISLTPQTRRRFRARFDRVAVLHSHLSDAERHGHWRQIARGEIQVVVGARSAIFAPTPNLGLIVLDEEHDGSFKQDKAPRYHARDVALQRAEMLQIPLVLGSATPALETWQQAAAGSFRLVQMPQRVNQLPMPQVVTVDLRSEIRNRQSSGSISRSLHMAMKQSLADDGQVILLLNRRGFATSIQCPACGFVVKCPECDIALTHHRDQQRAVCHYCEFCAAVPQRCNQCDFEGIRFAGVGTQRLEAEVQARFPHVSCLRMDSDTMQRPGSHEQALERFRSGEVRILLGTQMIAKGLDFPNVTLVGVINADTALHFPDFRAAERTFGLVTQVAGRTGRGDKGGRVLVQTFSPEHSAIQAASEHHYERFAANELQVRSEFGYPPAGHMARLVFRGESQQKTLAFAEHLVQEIHQQNEAAALHLRVLGPAATPIAKLRGRFRFHALVQSEQAGTLQMILGPLQSQVKPPEGVQWMIDIDPLDML